MSGAGTQTIVQMAVDDSMRGRVMSMFGIIFRGGSALGALIIGAISEVAGLRLPLANWFCFSYRRKLLGYLSPACHD